MKRNLLMILFLMVAVFVGKVLGDVTMDFEGLTWLSKALDFGISTTELNLGVLVLTIGFQVHITVAEVLMVLLVVLSFSTLAKKILG